MADGGVASGRIRPQDADQVLIACLICVATSRTDSTDKDLALQLIREFLPLASASARVEALREAAEGIIAAAPRRRTPAGARDWCLAHLDLSRALATDAIRVAKAKLGAGHAG
jgi:hypothetical protein